MREIKIFLASSYELEADRVRIGNLIRELNELYLPRAIHLRLAKWEDMDAFYNRRSKQEEYDREICSSQIFLGLFWHRAGRHTLGETRLAHEHGVRLYLFRKSQEYIAGEDEQASTRRYLEKHGDEESEENITLARLFEELHETPQTYSSFAELKEAISKIISDYCEEDGAVFQEYTPPEPVPEELQVFVAPTAETELDYAYLGDAVRLFNQLGWQNIRMVTGNPEQISASGIFISLNRTSFPKQQNEVIRKAVATVETHPLFLIRQPFPGENAEANIGALKEYIRTLGGYPRDYASPAEMILFFIVQLTWFFSGGQRGRIVISNGTIALNLNGKDRSCPLVDCFDLPSFQQDDKFKKLRTALEQCDLELGKLESEWHIAATENRFDIFEKKNALEEKLQERQEIYEELQQLQQRLLDMELDLQEQILKEKESAEYELFRAGRKDRLALFYADAVLKTKELLAQLHTTEKMRIRWCKQKDDLDNSANFIRNVLNFFQVRLKYFLSHFFVRKKPGEEEFSGPPDVVLQKLDQKLEDLKQYLSRQLETHICGAKFQFLRSDLSQREAQEQACVHYEFARAIANNLTPPPQNRTYRIWLPLADLYFDLEKYQEALPVYEEAKTILCRKDKYGTSEDIIDIYDKIGFCHYFCREYDLAIESYQAELQCVKLKRQQDFEFLHVPKEENTLDAHCHILLGHAQSEKGDYDSAMDNYVWAWNILQNLNLLDTDDTATVYNNMADIYHEKGNYRKALEYYQKALEIKRKIRKENDIVTSFIYGQLGYLWAEMGDCTEALKFHKEALDIQLNILEENNPRLATSYMGLGIVLHRKGDYDQAVFCYQKALNIKIKVYGEESLDAARCYKTLGVAWYQKQNCDEALKYFQKALNIFLKKSGDGDSICGLYMLIGDVWRLKKNHDEALSSYQKAHDVHPVVLGENNMNLGLICNVDNLPWKAEGNCGKAPKRFPNAFEPLGESHPDIAVIYTKMGVVWAEKGNLDQALVNLQRALEIQLNRGDELNSDMAFNFYNQGMTWYMKRDFAQALENLQKALEIWQSLGKEFNQNIVMAYLQLGLTWFDKGDFDRALENCLKALEIQLRIGRILDCDTATLYYGLGESWYDKGDFDQALVNYWKALDIRLLVLGEFHQDTALVYNNIGAAWQKKGDYDRALEFRGKALEIRLKISGEKDPDVALSYNRIGTVHQAKGEYDKALECYQKALNIQLDVLGEEHPDSVKSYKDLESLWRARGDAAKAAEYQQKIQSIQQTSSASQ